MAVLLSSDLRRCRLKQVKHLYNAIGAAVKIPAVNEALVDKQGNVINPMTPEASAAYFKSEHDRFAQLVRKADVKVD